MTGRYRIGVLTPEAQSTWNRFHPILDTQSPTKVWNEFGIKIVALVDTQEMAEKIVVFLNLERLR